MTTAAAPDYGQIAELPATRTAVVVPDFIDENGHLSTTHYFDLCGRGSDSLLRHIGIDDEYREGRRFGVFAVSQHMRYFAELREGEEFSVHPRALGRTGKAFHTVTLLANASQRRLACTMETIFVHVDLTSRRATPMPDSVVEPLDRLLAEHAALTWSVPLCGFRQKFDASR